jgi:hypothetical protein
MNLLVLLESWKKKLKMNDFSATSVDVCHSCFTAYIRPRTLAMQRIGISKVARFNCQFRRNIVFLVCQIEEFHHEEKSGKTLEWKN